jgi:hypothetical protein
MNRCAAIVGVNRAGNGFNGVRAPQFRCKAPALAGAATCSKHTARPTKWGTITGKEAAQ